MEERLK